MKFIRSTKRLSQERDYEFSSSEAIVGPDLASESDFVVSFLETEDNSNLDNCLSRKRMETPFAISIAILKLIREYVRLIISAYLKLLSVTQDART